VPRWGWALTAAVAALVMVLVSASRSRPRVTLATVTQGRVVAAVYAPGTVTSRTQTVIAAAVAGRVTAVSVGLGDPVVPGQEVARLDDTQARYQLDQAREELAAAEAQRQQGAANVDAARARAHSARQTVAVQREQVGAIQARAAAADAQVRAARAGADSARDAYERQRFLYERGAIAERRLVEARTALRAAEAQHEQARANAAAARQEVAQADAGVAAARAQVAEAESGVAGARAALSSADTAVNAARTRVAAAQDTLERYAVRSLVRGIVSETPLDVGAFAQVGAPVARVVSPEHLYVRADVDETDIGPVTTGQTAYFTADASPETSYQGIVTRIGASADPATNTYPVEITRLETTAGLRVNMSVDVNIVTRVNERATLAPAAAVVEEPAPHVWQVAPDGRLAQTPVTLGARDDATGRVEIRAGLAPGERVVADPRPSFRAGQRARVSE